MYFYELGYYSYEDSSYKQLQHEKLFTQEEFDDIVIQCVPAAIESYIKKRGRIDRLEKELRIGFDAIHDLVVEAMVKQFGFSFIEYSATYATFGWADLIQNEGWSTETGNDERYSRLSETAHNAYVAAGYWKAEDSYKYLWCSCSFYGESKEKEDKQEYLNNAIWQAQTLGIHLEQSVEPEDKDGCPSDTIHLRIPKEEIDKMPVSCDGSYFLGDNNGKYNAVFYFSPLWYSKREFYNTFRIAERMWQVVSDGK